MYFVVVAEPLPYGIRYVLDAMFKQMTDRGCCPSLKEIADFSKYSRCLGEFPTKGLHCKSLCYVVRLLASVNVFFMRCKSSCVSKCLHYAL